MKCGGCNTELAGQTADGTPHLKTVGLLIKAGQLVMRCPRCKGDVMPTEAVLKSLRLVIRQSPGEKVSATP